MNFELVDNTFQILMLGGAALVSFFLAIRYVERRFLILALAYLCFTSGTTYYTLHIAILGDIPRVTSVAEISWLASYLFFLYLQLYRVRDRKLRFFLPSALAAIVVANEIFRLEILGPSRFLCGVFALSMGTIVYIAIFLIKEKKKFLCVDVGMLLVSFLQISLYISSVFMTDFTRFNFYFAIDICLTTVFVMLIPLTYREVKNHDVY